MNKKKIILFLIFIFAIFIFFLGISYILWRWIFTLNVYTSPFTSFWSYSLIIAELITFLAFTNFTLIIVKSFSIEKTIYKNKKQKDYFDDVYKNGELISFKNFCPSVDIFICTYNESADILAVTIAAAKNIDYPNKKVYVLDDGHRDEIKNLTELLECNYISRKDNKGYKSGNINNALTLTNSDLILIFDADHAPASTFLRETAYFFVNEKVALVQTPQYFNNPDAFQKNLKRADKLANEQDMFYRIIEPSLNEFDSVFCGGTNIILNRKALNSVGNFPEDTITEDSLLGLKLHSFGYKVIYYNKPLAVGLAASTFNDYISQRIRWAKGNLQILTNSNNWKYYAKLKPMQLFFYLSGVLYFFTPITRIIYLLAPVLFLIFNVSPLIILFYQIALFQLCYFSTKFVFLTLSKVRMTNVWFADVYDLLTSIFTISGVLKTLLIPGRLQNIKFNVTQKETHKVKKIIKYKIIIVAIFLLLIFAEAQGVYDLLYNEPYNPLAIVANLFWNTTNIIVIYWGLKVVSEQPEKRFYQRIKALNTIKLFSDEKNYNAIIEDISRSGFKIILPKDFDEENKYKTEIYDNENIEIINCQEKNDLKTCKMKFETPFSIKKITKFYINKLEAFVKLAYKNPKRWDEYYKRKK